MLRKLQDKLFYILDDEKLDSTERANQVKIIANQLKQIDLDCLETLKRLEPESKIELNSSLDVPHSSYRGTPLTIAIRLGDKASVSALLDAGADANFTDRDNITPLLQATGYDHESIVRLLVQHKAQVNLCDEKDGITALHNATSYCSLAITQFLVEQKAEINAATKTKIGATPLINAAYSDATPIVRYLLEHRAQINFSNKEGTTALIAAAQGGYHSNIRLLLERGAEIESLCIIKFSALDYAIFRSKNLTCIFHLLNHGALIRDVEKLRTFLQTQDPNDPQVQFCYGRLCEQEGHLAKAESHYQTAINTHQLAPAYRRSGELFEAKGHLFWAFNRYTLAMQGDDFLAPGKLVTLAQKELDSPQPQIFSTLMVKVLCEIPLTSHLTSSQWCFMARQLQGYPGEVGVALQNQFCAATNARLTAKNEREEVDADEVIADIYRCSKLFGGFFTTHFKPKATQDETAFDVNAALESSNIVLEYVGDDADAPTKMKNAVMGSLLQRRLG